MNNEDIQKVLMLAAMQNEQNRFDGPEGGTVGALAGAGIGALAATPVHMYGKHKQNNINKKAAAEGMSVAPRQKIKDRVRPGARMAGTLVGTLIGGGLGAGTAELMKRESPHARLLAKIQTQNGRLTPSDEAVLQNMLTDIYSNPSALVG